MKNILTFGVTLIFIIGCQQKQAEEKAIFPKAQVEAVSFKSGEITDEIKLQAQSGYMVKNVVMAPVNSYVQKTYIKQGDKVQTGQVLYELATKERKATEQLLAVTDSVYKNVGAIQIKASSAGIVSSISSQTGDYVTEGTQMCKISDIGSLVFIVQVPFEYNSLVKTGATCNIVLSDGKIIIGTIKNELDQMSLNGQTRQYLVKPSTQMFIPENLLATVIITTQTASSNQILPVSCVLTDEMMQNFWVMKLINDTTAVKINVKTGLKNKDEVEISEPIFSPTDRILSQGNYGLSDTALVNVIKH